MPLTWFQRAKVIVGRPLSSLLLDSPIAARLAQRHADRFGDRGLDPGIAAVLALDDLVGDSDVSNKDPATARAMIAESVALADEAPAAELDVRDTSLDGAAGPIRARIYEIPGLARPSPGLLYIHGGGWVTGDVDTHDSLCRKFALAKMRVVSIDYRLAPEHPFPAAAEDAVAAFRSLVREARSLGIDPSRIAVAGDSAGGNLSAVVGLQTRADTVRPALTVLLYPALDATRSLPSHRALADGYFLTKAAIDWYYGHYVGADAAIQRDPHASPLLAPDVKGAPRTIMITCGFDPLKDEGVAYAKRLADAGVQVDPIAYPTLIHGFALMTRVSVAAREATRDVIAATRRALG